MNPLLNGAMLMLVLAGGHPAQTPPVSETTHLHCLDAKNVPALVKPTPGLQSIAANFADGTVSVRGAAQGVKTIKAEVFALDVQPVSYRLSATVTRYQVETDGRYSEAIAMSPTMMTQDKTSARISIMISVATTKTGTNKATEAHSSVADTKIRYALQLTPTHNADGSITLLAEVQKLGEKGEIIQSGRNTRRVALGETARVVGMTDATNIAVRRRAMKGEAVRNAGALVGYCVQVRAEQINDQGEPVKL